VFMSVSLYADFGKILEILCGAELPGWNSRLEYHIALRPYGGVSYLSNQDCVTGTSGCCQIGIAGCPVRSLPARPWRALCVRTCFDT